MGPPSLSLKNDVNLKEWVTPPFMLCFPKIIAQNSRKEQQTMKNVENISIWRFGYKYLTCCRLIVVLLGFSCLTAVYADSRSVQTKIGDIYIKNNRLYCSNDEAKKSLTGSRLVGALYNASFDGRYVLYGGAKIEEGLLFPDITLYVIDVQSRQITNLNELYSLNVVGGGFASNSYDLALVNINDRTLYIVDFEFGKIKKSFSLSRAQDLSFQPVWNAVGDQVAIYLTDCVDSDLLTSWNLL